MVCDQGTEFTGRPFANTLSESGIMIHYTDVRSPWQNSRTEKAGGIFKSRLEKVCHETTAVDEQDFKIALAETIRAHNMYYDRSGHTPCQRVFGTTPRMPRSLLSDDYLDKEFLGEPESDYVKRADKIRVEAQKAWMETQDSEAVSRAARSNTRMTDVKPLEVGDFVYVRRDTPDYRGWIGPGLLVAESENGRSLWVSVRGYLVKASREQVRRATSEESLGAEMAQMLSAGLLEDLESGRVKNYKDVTEEGVPLSDPPGADPPPAERRGVESELEEEMKHETLETIAEENEMSDVEETHPVEAEEPEHDGGDDSTRAPTAPTAPSEAGTGTTRQHASS